MTQHVTHKTPTLAPPHVSELRVDRVAGLSAEDLCLTLDRTVLAEAELTAVEHEAHRLGELVSDILFRLVPALQGDSPARRRTLSLRRATRPGKTPRPEDVAAVRPAVQEHLDAGDLELLDVWLHAVQARDAAQRRYQQDYSREVDGASSALRAVAQRDEFVRGVAHASPSLGACLDTIDTAPYRQASRGLSSYATRAAFKTSPFSELTTVTHNGPTDRRSERLYVAPGVVHEWFQAMTKDPELALGFAVEPLQTGRTEIRRVPALVAETLHTKQFTWVRDRRVDLSEYADVLDRLRWLGRQPVSTYLEAIGGHAPFATLSRLCDVHMIRFVTPWEYAHRDRLGALIAALETRGSEKAQAVTAQLRTVRQSLEDMRHMAGIQRARALRELVTPTLPGAPATQVFSDVMGGIPVPSALPAAETELARVLAGIRPLMFRSFIYTHMCQDFQDTFGSGGRCDDVAGYLGTLAAQHALQQAIVKDMTAALPDVARYRDAPVGRSSTAPACAVMYQVSAASAREAAQGEGLIVLNQLNPGLGGLVARFDPGDSHPSELREGLRAWLHRLYPHATPLEFVASSDVNHMQAVSEGTLPRLVWPTDTPRAGDDPGAVSIAELHLRHDPLRHTVELCNAAGQPVAPVYLGLVPAHLLSGASRLLAVLGDPWVNRASWLVRSPGMLGGGGEQPPHTDRVQRGRVVFKRETWTVPAQQVPMPGAHETELDYFRRLQHFREAWKLPREVFVRIDRRGSAMDTTAWKPVWTSFASPHAWAPVADRLKTARSVTFQEVLPGTAGCWLTDEQGRHRAVEHISFFTWPAGAPDSEEATP